jgi:hypothetical protein
MAYNANTFDPSTIFRGNSALGLDNPVFDGHRKAGKGGIAAADLEDFLLFASKNTAQELATLKGLPRSKIEALIFDTLTRVARARQVARPDLKYAFDVAFDESGARLRRMRETSMVGLLGREQATGNAAEGAGRAAEVQQGGGAGEPAREPYTAEELSAAENLLQMVDEGWRAGDSD